MRDVTPLPDLLHGQSHAGPGRENIQAWLSQMKVV